jgi:hypothetical protein
VTNLSATSQPARPHRLLAAGCAVLVFLLGLMSASPALHAWVHESECAAHDGCHEPAPPSSTAPDAQCVVVWFAQGVALAADLVAPATVPVVWIEKFRPAGAELMLISPRHRLPLERGPPLRLS